MARFSLLLLAACVNSSSPGTNGAEVQPKAPLALSSNGVAERPPKMVEVEHDCPVGGSLDAPIAVRDRSRVLRIPPLTSFLVPIAKQAGLRSLKGVAVYDEAGQRLPAQLEVLSRWGGGPGDCDRPIRYAYARVGAVPGPGKEANWRVKSGATEGEMTPLLFETQAGAWIVDTGVARFTVRRDRFEGLSKVELPDGDRWVVVSELGADTGQSSFFIDHAGKLLSIGDAKMWKLELERSGPQVVTVVARGYLPGQALDKRKQGPNAARGLGITMRLHFYARSSIVRVEVTYYHGAVAGWTATDLANTTLIHRAWMTLPLAERAEKIYARADNDIFTLDPRKVVQVEQEKREPNRPNLAYTIRAGSEVVGAGERAWKPFLAAVSKRFYVLATIAHLAEREPQGFTWSNELNALDVDFTSAPIQIGGARGIWSIAAIDFGRGLPDESRIEALQTFAERPLLGAPLPFYANETRTIGPYAVSSSGVAGAYADLSKQIHDRTKHYLERIRITGLQVWPDLPASSCEIDGNCQQWESAFYSGGANNYWNWSKPGFDEFFRTADSDFVYDFSLGEAITYAETLAVRVDHHHLGDSSVAGLAPCYGDATGYDNTFIEGTGNRRDRCPADYSYDKTLELAFLATGDFRFVDFFEEAGTAALNIFGEPPRNPQPYLELNLSRLSTQRLEMIADGAEFAREEKTSELLRSKLRAYVDHMLGRTLIDGHACEVGGTGRHDVTESGKCDSVVGWMMPVGTEWAIRTSQILDHDALLRWVIRHGAVSAKNHTGSKKPDGSRRDWRVGYGCRVSKKGEVSDCQPWASGENDARFYANGLLAYLNVFGLILGADPSDPNGLCTWLPSAYQTHLGSLGPGDLNAHVWGKASGQALAFAAEAVAAILRCKPRPL